MPNILDLPYTHSQHYRPRESAHYVVAALIVTKATGAGLPTKRYATQPETEATHVRQQR